MFSQSSDIMCTEIWASMKANCVGQRFNEYSLRHRGALHTWTLHMETV